MIQSSRAERIRSHLEQRIASVLDWYVGSACCTETLENVKHDLDVVLAEASSTFHVELPFLFRARFEGPKLVVSVVTRDLS